MSLLEFFKGCRRPLYYKSKVNKLNVHVLLSLGGIRQCMAKYRFVYGQAYIVRDPKGWYRFVGFWTLPTKPSRADMWVEGRFKRHKGQMKFEESKMRSPGLPVNGRHLIQKASRGHARKATTRGRPRDEALRVFLSMGLQPTTLSCVFAPK